MIANGEPIDAVACASTGDTSAALAAYGAAAGIPTVVFLPRDKVSPAQLVQPLANGALVSPSTPTSTVAWRGARGDAAKRIYLANSMNSLRIEGQKTIADRNRAAVRLGSARLGHLAGRKSRQRERLWQRLSDDARAWLDLKAAAHLRRAGRERQSALSLLSEKLRALRADDRAAKPLASAIQIGNPVSIRKAIATLQRFNGVVEQASELELAEEVARADRTGMFNCPHTGVALAALRKLVESKIIHGHERVVVISTAHGLKFADQKIAYHAGTLEGIQGNSIQSPGGSRVPSRKRSAMRSRATSSVCGSWTTEHGQPKQRR